MRSVSKKQRDRLVEYRSLRKEYLEGHPICEYHGCRSAAREIHHKARRSGKNLFRHFMAVCRKHHRWIESHPKESRQLGYLIRRSGR